MTDRQRKALQLFAKGYNCSQSVLMAYSDVAGLTDQQAASLAAGLGGGVGRLREVCGAFSAAALVCGPLEGEDATSKDVRNAVYKRVRDIRDTFVEEWGSVVCADLLQIPRQPESPEPDPRNKVYYHRKPCAKIVRSICMILDEELEKKKDV